VLRAGAAIAAICLLAAQPAAMQAPAVTTILDTYLSGEYDAAVATGAAQDVASLRLHFVQDVPGWIGSDSATMGRRGAAAAAFLLELAAARLDTDWHRFTDLIEATCVNLRRSDSRTQFELAWHRASLALAGRARARRWLLGDSPVLPNEPVRPRREAPRTGQATRSPEHLMHALARFPDDRSLQLARIVAWTWGRDAEPIRNTGDDDDRSDTSMRASPQQRAITALTPIVDDPTIGDEALFRIGQMQLSLGLNSEARVSFEQAGRRARSREVKYLAFFLAGRTLDALKESEPAMRAYEQALEIFPGAESASVALASLRFTEDDREAAASLIQRNVGRPAAGADPGRLVGYGSYMHWPALRADMRAELQK